jgi:hypothetical protein
MSRGALIASMAGQDGTHDHDATPPVPSGRAVTACTGKPGGRH